MSWTGVFPVLSDEMVREYDTGASKAERAELEEWFGVERVISPKPATRHLVSFSLFWKNRTAEEPDLPPIDRRMLKNARRRGLVRQYEPWSHYVEPLLESAAAVLATREDVSFRVYLAADLKFLSKDLLRAGCEVFLMKCSSLRHNPGAMWRFLALEEKDRMVTVTDSDRARVVEADLVRTEETTKAGLALWRVPVWGDIGVDGTVPYRPMMATHFGGCPRLPMRKLLKAFVWHQRRGSIAKTCQIPTCGEWPIAGSEWPDYGVDEYFLLAAVYPRVARMGIVSFVPSDARSQLLVLDIEYATWANPRSEIVYFGAEKCCPPVPPAAEGPEAAPEAIPELKFADTAPGLMEASEFKLLDTAGLTQQHRLSPWAKLHREDITGEVFAWSNPSCMVWKQKRWLVYRTECAPLWHWTRTSLVNLDEKFQPIPGTNKILNLPTDFGGWGAEDPRLSVWQDRLFLTYGDGYRIGVGEVQEDGSVTQASLLSSRLPIQSASLAKDRREKNWGFFGMGGTQLVSYWVKPHIVLEWDFERRTMRNQWEAHWDPPFEIKDDLHGGSAPLWHDGLFWRVVHSGHGRMSCRCYRLWLLAFKGKPPFKPVWFSARPLVVGEPEKTQETAVVAHHVVFCGSLERVKNGWLIFLGENDLRIRYGVVEDRVVEPHLKRVGR